MAGSIVYGIFFAALGGYVSAVLGGGSPRFQGSVVGITPVRKDVGTASQLIPGVRCAATCVRN